MKAHLFLASWITLFDIDLITMTILCERYKLLSASLWYFLHLPLSSLLGIDIRFMVLKYSQPVFSITKWNHISIPYITTSNIIVLCVLKFKFRKRNWEDKSSCFKFTFYFLMNRIWFINKKRKYLNVFSFHTNYYLPWFFSFVIGHPWRLTSMNVVFFYIYC